MKMRVIITALLAFYTLSASGALEEQRVDANFTAFEFNSISSQYMPRPTFAKISKGRPGSPTVLVFQMDAYGKYGAEIQIGIEFVDENIEAINKYLQWAAMAKERGDMLDKEIATVRGVNVGLFYDWVDYQFHSGNEKSHYLIITQKRKGLFGNFENLSKPFALNEENANRLIKRLTEFKEEKIVPTKVDDYK